MRKTVGCGILVRRSSFRCRADSRSDPNGFSIATASVAPRSASASAESTDSSRTVGRARYTSVFRQRSPTTRRTSLGSVTSAGM